MDYVFFLLFHHYYYRRRRRPHPSKHHQHYTYLLYCHPRLSMMWVFFCSKWNGILTTNIYITTAHRLKWREKSASKIMLCVLISAIYLICVCFWYIKFMSMFWFFFLLFCFVVVLFSTVDDRTEQVCVKNVTVDKILGKIFFFLLKDKRQAKPLMLCLILCLCINIYFKYVSYG